MSLMEIKFPFARDGHGWKWLKQRKEPQIEDASDRHNAVIKKRKLNVV